MRLNFTFNSFLFFRLNIFREKLFLTFVLFLFQFSLFAATNTYTGPAAGGWNTASNWSLGTVPTSTDDVVIPSGKTVVLNVSSVYAKSITVSGEIEIPSDSNISINSLLIVVTSPSGRIFFNKKSIITLPQDVALYLQNGVNSLDTSDNGVCSNNTEIHVGTTNYAVCTGGGALYSFDQVETAGGINVATAGVIGAAQNICGGTVPNTLTSTTAATGSGTITYEWQTNASGSYVTIGGATSATYSPPALTSTTSYQRRTVSVINGQTFYSQYTSSVTITVTSTTAAPTGTASQSFCASSNPTVANLSATGTAIKWYSTSTGGSALASNIVLTNGAHYYASQTLNGCESASRFDVTVTVTALPTAGLTSNDADNTFCAGTSVTFTATGGTNYNFRVGGSSVQNSTTSTYTTTALTNGQVVDVIVTNASGCTATSSGISNTVTALPTAGLTSSDADNTFCVGTSVTFTATGGTNYNFRVGGSSVQNSTTSTYTTTALTNGQVVDVIVTNASGCTATSSGISNTVTALPIAGLTSSDADNTFCAGTSVTFTATGGTNYNFRVGGSSVQNSTTSTYTTTALTNGQVVDVIVTNASGCTATSSGITNTVNNLPLAPSAGIPTNPTCTVPTGSVKLNGLPSSGTIIQTGSYSNVNYTITGGGTQTISGLLPGTYYFAVDNGSCISDVVSVVIIAPVTNTWSSGSWSNGTPAINQRLIFASNYTNANDVDIEGCSCQITGTTAVTIKSGRTLKIENGIDVAGTASLTFENNASLVQINDAAVNSGNINYHRYTAPVKRYDFTYWSSPVAGQTLHDLSPNTLYDKYYSYNPNTGWVISYNGVATMVKGNGYLIRAPQYFDINVATIDTNPVFIGIPNNGVVTLSSLAGNQTHLLGNPYPSAIDADAFLDANSTVLEGTLYFWTHNTPPSTGVVGGDATYSYISNDYATYNRTGGVGTSGLGAVAASGGKVPSGKIAAGQGFFAPTKATGNVIFNNSMRVSGNNNQFFKLSTSKTTTTNTVTEKSRVWLNLTNKEGAYKQMLVGYITGATNDYDGGFDGETYDGNQYVDFYSVNKGTNLSIQGRALPFVKQDSVALGYKSAIKGEFQISIDHTDGELSSQNIFLEDKDLKVLYDLKKGAYTFSTVKGVFNTRFVLRYVDKNAIEPVVEAPKVDEPVLVSVQQNEITVSSSEDLISKIIIYDISGKIIYQKEDVAASDYIIQRLLSSQQVLFVNVILQNGKTTSTKIIY